MTLLKDKDREKIMKQWDYWRKQIASGFTGSYPRDWFESVLEFCEERHEKILDDVVHTMRAR